ncbi:glutathione S-transferase family protein [Pseudomonas viridiflava]|jgi:Glutathione S-transferase|uniref:Glutathione S-transferase family protein n=1 Tax=Pseudomonas viridiflava TaxID=33069 RepID=A0ABU7N230_PSEVI|nr:glutathione S-transferase family protein [Pseudomonas viridiflava]MDY0917898.1 glutathione S-transferase family protein [Pseudomonas viridiflava]MEE3915027.1 glutathione S-transferase family protein [Pseudomonas viridiflava]MEE3925603.1 glutathione S-transferase family protein [Pseudomonas viridiflava]MEE3932058.1 glutathione S-transferase family protein [Pseudomonas viridiflava]MEE3934466.1 glutathione S-transferase family protein [Pseudomonas viridiflava]
MSLHLIIGDKRYSSWSLRPWLVLEMTGAPFTDQVIRLNLPDTRENILKYSPTGKVPALQCEHGTIIDSLAICEYLVERFPDVDLWPRDVSARAQARSACAQMHSGFMSLRSNMPMDLRQDQALEVIPVDTQADIDRIVALWAECRKAAREDGPFLFGRPSIADAFFAPVAIRLRTYRVALPDEALAYIETIYQWPAFQRWQQAGLEES